MLCNHRQQFFEISYSYIFILNFYEMHAQIFLKHRVFENIQKMFYYLKPCSFLPMLFFSKMIFMIFENKFKKSILYVYSVCTTQKWPIFNSKNSYYILPGLLFLQRAHKNNVITCSNTMQANNSFYSIIGPISTETVL